MFKRYNDDEYIFIVIRSKQLSIKMQDYGYTYVKIDIYMYICDMVNAL